MKPGTSLSVKCAELTLPIVRPTMRVMADFKKWILDNQVLSGIGGVLITLIAGGIGRLVTRRMDKNKSTSVNSTAVGRSNISIGTVNIHSGDLTVGQSQVHWNGENTVAKRSGTTNEPRKNYGDLERHVLAYFAEHKSAIVMDLPLHSEIQLTNLLKEEALIRMGGSKHVNTRNGSIISSTPTASQYQITAKGREIAAKLATSAE